MKNHKKPYILKAKKNDKNIKKGEKKMEIKMEKENEDVDEIITCLVKTEVIVRLPKSWLETSDQIDILPDNNIFDKNKGGNDYFGVGYVRHDKNYKQTMFWDEKQFPCKDCGVIEVKTSSFQILDDDGVPILDSSMIRKLEDEI